jgi:hypothetical protein
MACLAASTKAQAGEQRDQGVQSNQRKPGRLAAAAKSQLEPATSCVTVWPDLVLQLTRPRGLPKYAEIVQDIACCGLGCGLKICRKTVLERFFV